VSSRISAEVTTAKSTAYPIPAVELVHASAAYGPYRALFDVSLSVHAGGALALVGSNGAGKSTVARVISGLVPLSSGRLFIGGMDLTGRSPWEIARAGIAHVPEGRGVFASLTVEENLQLSFRQRTGHRQVGDVLDQAYDKFPVLGERRAQRAGTLSGGEQRLLSLAKVLVLPPKLLVADELSLGLSPAWSGTVYEGLSTIHAAGTSLLIVEQQIDRVLSIADAALVLDNGVVAWQGPPDGAVEAIDRLRSTGSRPPGPDGPFASGANSTTSGSIP